MIKYTNVKMFHKFLKSLKWLDKSGINIQFRINQKDAYRTKFGGAIFLLFLLFSMGYILFNFLKFVNKSNVNLIYTTKMAKSSPTINLTSSNFTIALGFFFAHNNAPAYDIIKQFADITYQFTIKESNNTRYEIIPTKDCEKKDFDFLSNETYSENFYGKMLCPNVTGLNYTISGFTSETYNKNFMLNVSLKPEYSLNLSEYKTIFNQHFIISTLLFKESAMDYENIASPVTSYLKSEIIYLLPERCYQSVYYMAQIRLTTDTDPLFASPQLSNQSILVDEVEPYSLPFVTRDAVQEQLNNCLLIHSFLPSNKIFIMSRTYQKLPEFLANMTGLLSQCLFLLSIFVTFLNKIALDYRLLTKTMKFKGNKHFDIDYLTSMFYQEINHLGNGNNLMVNGAVNSQPLDSVLRSNYIHSSDRVPKISQVSQFGPSRLFKKTTSEEVELDIKSNMEHKKRKKKNSGIPTASDFILLSACKCLTNNKEKQIIIQKVSEKLSIYLEIFTYMKKIQEIELIKILLFSKEQIDLINFLSKPPICINHMKSQIYKDYVREQHRTMELQREEANQIIESYKIVSNSEEMTDMDKRLLELVETEMTFLSDG